MKLHQKLETTIEKAIKLTELYGKSVSKNVALESEVNALKQLLEKEKSEKNELLEKIKLIKLAQNIGSSNSGDTGKEELKKKLNEYIKEIDICITMLNG